MTTLTDEKWERAQAWLRDNAAMKPILFSERPQTAPAGWLRLELLSGEFIYVHPSRIELHGSYTGEYTSHGWIEVAGARYGVTEWAVGDVLRAAHAGKLGQPEAPVQGEFAL